MAFVKENWTVDDGRAFVAYLKTLSNPDKIPFARKVINSSKEMLGIMTPTLRSIVKEISKGNFMSFLDLKLNDYYENSVINGMLICKIKNADELLPRLTEYAIASDCWAEIDLIKLSIKKDNAQVILDYAVSCTKETLPFVRRLGVILLFGFIKEEYFDIIMDTVISLKSDEEYYVNMAVAWLMCELVIKLPSKAVQAVNSNNLNKFTLHKTVSKCYDSFRVPRETVAELKKRL